MVEVRVDDRNRIAVPSRFMEVLRSLEEYKAVSDGFEIVVGLDRTSKVGLFPKSVHEEMLDRLPAADDADPLGDEVRTVIYGSSESCVLDKQNRARIPALLADWGNLRGEVVVLGVGNYLQVVSKEEWKASVSSLKENFRALVGRSGGG